MFESSVNSEGIETSVWLGYDDERFESSVNSEGIETIAQTDNKEQCLRAV